jgi:aldose 1-epimerase
MHAQNYTATESLHDGLQTVSLADAERQTRVSVLVSIGNNAYEMSVNGVNLFWSPLGSITEQKAKPSMLGNPFLAPWANRLDREGYSWNGRAVALQSTFANYRKDANGLPIHGLLVYSPYWQLIEAKAGAKSAWCTSRLEFWRHADLMAQFPWAHTIEMTYRLSNGELSVETVLRNHTHEAMPVSIGYHPYFRVTDAPRDEWTVTLPVTDQVVLSEKLVPTGERRPSPHQGEVKLKGVTLDDVFTGLTGQREFVLRGARQTVTVTYGPKYPVAVVFAPPGRDFVCFEPMAGITNAINLYAAGKYPELQSIPAGGEWRETFTIKASGF